MKPLSNKFGFVPGDSAITVVFELINPLASHYVLGGGGRDKSSCALLLKCLKLLIHGMTPLWMFGGSRIGSGFCKCIVSMGCITKLRFKNTIFASGLHGMGIRRDWWDW